jgi:predicted membrane metal-binding protein
MRYSVLICIALVLGILWGLYNLYIAPFFLLLTIILLYLTKSKFKNIKRVIITFSVFFVVAVAYMSYKNSIFETKYQNNSIIEDTGILLDLLSSGDYYNKYIFQNSYNDRYIIYIPNIINVNPMDVVSIKGTFEKPSKARNVNCFDYSKYLYSQNLYGSIYVKSSNDISIVGKSTNFFYLLKHNIVNTFKRNLHDRNFSILLGMIIGDTIYIDSEIKDSFKACGITHILAVSGSNISYLILFSRFLLEKLFGKKLSNYLSIIIIICFIIISGSSASVMRARHNGNNYNSI